MPGAPHKLGAAHILEGKGVHAPKKGEDWVRTRGELVGLDCIGSRVVQDEVEKANRRPTDRHEPTDTASLTASLKIDNF